VVVLVLLAVLAVLVVINRTGTTGLGQLTMPVVLRPGQA